MGPMKSLIKTLEGEEAALPESVSNLAVEAQHTLDRMKNHSLTLIEEW